MKYNMELLKNIEFVFNEKYGKKIIVIPYNLIRSIYFETILPELPELYHYTNNSDDSLYFVYDPSVIKEYIIKYVGTIGINKKISDYELDIEAIKYLTDMKKLINLSYMVFNYNNNTKMIYKNIIQVCDDVDKYELSSTFDKNHYESPSVVDIGQEIHLTFVYDCGTYKRVDTPNK